MTNRDKKVSSGPKKVGIWIRVSTEDQAQGESPDHHKRRAELYAESKGWDIVRVYDLSGVSGKTVANHPAAKAMLADVKAGTISGLIFSKLARLARNTRELLDFAEYFETHGADLVSIAESIDTSTPAGRFFYTLIAALAQWEREEISSRIKASVLTRASMGKNVSGAAPFGYRCEGSTLVPDPVEAPIRKHMIELFLDLGRLRSVATQLNKAGHRTRKGTKFSDTTVRRLIEDPITKGERRANYSESRGHNRRWDYKPPDQWIIQAVEPIVPAEVWEAANKMLSDRKKGSRPKQRTVHLFSGLARCECGAKLVVKFESPNYACPACKRRIAITDLEEVFRHQLEQFFLSKEQVAAHLTAANAQLVERQKLLEALRTESQTVRRNMDKVYALYLEDLMSPEAFRDRYTPLEARSKELLEEISKLAFETDSLALQHLTSTEVVAEAQGLYGHWHDLSRDEKRRVVESIVRAITVGEATVSIDLYYTPPAPSYTAVVGQHTHMDSSPRRAQTSKETVATPPRGQS